MQPNRNLLVRKLDPPQTWNPIVENHLRATGFYHVSRIGVIRGFHPMLAALVERWRPETHSFVLPIGEVTVTLEDVAHIFGLPIDGEPVSGWTDSSSEFVQNQGIAIFGREPSGRPYSRTSRPHMPMRSIYHCFAISSRSILTVGGQLVSLIFTEHYAVHHDMILRRWMAL
ncbi:uncharacterized protein DS421_10g315240 [Arachis hypogaea]|nr:uncharacterized protein DS421_10g315240 [Arachis hypogaea]